MSIETLLEAAKFLEWQALQQQKAREEDDLREKLRLNHEAEQKRAEVASLVQPVEVNHLTWSGRFCPEPCPTPVPPPAVPPPVPITVIPIPVLSASPKLLPTPAVTALTPLSDPRPSPPPAPPPQHQHLQLASQVKGESTALLQAPNPKQLLYPSPAPPASQHAPLLQPMPVQAPTSPTLQPAVTDDSRNLDAKRRPGGAGTREVHNKLEKNRRAHLKECFETLKKTVPTVDEKKTSNLSVLRSALRYIQTLKRKEKEYEHEMERLAREKISTQQRLAELKNELGQWMNVMEMERVLRLTAQPEDDQASTSTASEGEDNVDDNADEDHLQPPSKVPHMAQATPTAIPAQHQPPQPLVQLPAAPPAQSHAHTHVVTAASMPSVIAHASVIQAGSKHVAHLAPCSAPQAIVPAPCSAPQAIVSAPQATVSAPSSAPQPISHITVHPVAHLYPPTMMSHLAHTLTHAQVNTLTHAQVNTLTHAQVNTLTHAQVNALSHAQVNTLSPAQVNTLSHAQVNTLSHAQVNTLSHAQVNTLSQAQVNALTHAQVNCQPAVVTHHSQLVGQTVLNPVTMVTMPSFPVSTLKLA
ncbi:max-binding protein MNT-like [Anguilla anguilla]|uniref:max-binding protein MNT-like n=1 Tax=Anguilla anguilla TaxID=7936 RepID=UPI0015B0A1DB|nr:max-binding protein MNT-like [Anguilla anguilla]